MTVIIIPSLLIFNCGHRHKLVSQVINDFFGEMQIYLISCWPLIFSSTHTVAHMAHSSSLVYSFSMMYRCEEMQMMTVLLNV